MMNVELSLNTKLIAFLVFTAFKSNMKHKSEDT